MTKFYQRFSALSLLATSGLYFVLCDTINPAKEAQQNLPTCQSKDLYNAPDPVQMTVFESTQTYVPIDIGNVQANIVFDGAKKEAKVHSTVTFRSGVVKGLPLFDLRQYLDDARIDGIPLNDPNALSHIDLGGGRNAHMRSIKKELEPCTNHSLSLEYLLDTPLTQNGTEILWRQDQKTMASDVFWYTTLSDMYAGNYMEQWFPANLMYDHFSIELNIELSNAYSPHTLIANGTLEEKEKHKWKVTYPAHSTASSLFLSLVPSYWIDSANSTATLADGRKIPVEVHKHKDAKKGSIGLANAQEIAQVIAECLTEFSYNSGTYAHERFVAYIVKDGKGGMESDGAFLGGGGISIETIRHEVHHSWFARGVYPLSEDHGWIDEAWTEYRTGEKVLNPFSENDKPQRLFYDNSWKRTFEHKFAYTGGHRMFRTIAKHIGEHVLDSLMREFYEDNIHESITTAALEKHLVCKSGNPKVRQVFHRFVYGMEGQFF